MWKDKEKYVFSARDLLALFIKNFEKFGKQSQAIISAGFTLNDNS
jgi:ATP-dependent phosphoenolpyruvate carboxykinase